MWRSPSMSIATVGATVLLAVLPATALAGPAPTIESESASNITTTDATLEARIDPGSGEDGFALETTYEVFLEAPSCFSYGFGACEASGGVQIAKGTLPAGSSPQLVSVDIANVWHQLAPGTLYGYRVVASNQAGTVFGVEPELTFATLPRTAPCEPPDPLPDCGVVGPCVEDPGDCVPPPVGRCVEDPRDCVPPPVGRCVEDPRDCVTPPVGPCVEDPQDCTPPPPPPGAPESQPPAGAGKGKSTPAGVCKHRSKKRTAGCRRRAHRSGKVSPGSAGRAVRRK